ncbi:MAG: phage tail protein [Tannerellaceae bacterium]|nr:phage tail protein [Tannerellaceae bacterium]
MAYNGENIINGSDLMLFVDGKSVAYATSHSLDITNETADTSNKDTGGRWTSAKVTRTSWTVSTENLYALQGEGQTFNDLFELLQKEVKIVFCLESGYKSKPVTGVPSGGWSQVSSPKYSGDAIITSLSISAPDADNATFTAEFTGIGPLTTAATSGTSASVSNK